MGKKPEWDVSTHGPVPAGQENLFDVVGGPKPKPARRSRKKADPVDEQKSVEDPAAGEDAGGEDAAAGEGKDAAEGSEKSE